ncbi:MAG TPA: methionine ABC transporter ATP-binding protein, partial [Micromonospora sp.]
DPTVVLTPHDLADIERLCRRLVVIDHGRVVHDGSIDALHARYGSRRRMLVDLEEPVTDPPVLPGAPVLRTEADGHRIVFDLESATAAEVLTRLAGVATVRDISIVEPDIEDVVARLYRTPADAAPDLRSCRRS